MYFHFPGGKDQIVSEAVARSAEEIARLIAGVPATTAAGLVTTLIDMLADRLEGSSLRKGPQPETADACQACGRKAAIRQIPLVAA